MDVYLTGSARERGGEAADGDTEDAVLGDPERRREAEEGERAAGVTDELVLRAAGADSGVEAVDRMAERGGGEEGEGEPAEVIVE